MMNLTVNRKHKERLFLLVFRERHDLLSLYNAINGTHYTDPQKLEFTTIEDAIYMGIKNDISFMVGNVLNLWEHQSSYNRGKLSSGAKGALPGGESHHAEYQLRT